MMIGTCKNLVNYKIDKLPPFAKLIISNNIRRTNVWNFTDYFSQEVIDVVRLYALFPEHIKQKLNNELKK
jgi:hypothetical protein